MSSDSGTTILYSDICLPANAASLLFRKQLRQAKSDALLVFAIATFFGFGLAGLSETLLAIDFSPSVTLCIAVAFGISASLGMSLLHFSDWPAVLAELRAGRCSEIAVHCSKATKVRFRGSSLDGIAFDCESQVLLLVGGWWLSMNQAESAVDAANQQVFPSTKFRVRFLPESGRVLELFVEGSRLVVSEPVGGGWILSLQFPKYAEVIYLSRGLESLTV